MNAIKIMVKGWVKVLPFYLLILLPLFMSCSEADDTPEEYANWQAKNEAYFEEQYQKHLAASSSTCFVLKSYTKGDKLNVSEVAHTDCILVDVLPSDSHADSIDFNPRLVGGLLDGSLDGFDSVEDVGHDASFHTCGYGFAVSQDFDFSVLGFAAHNAGHFSCADV